MTASAASASARAISAARSCSCATPSGRAIAGGNRHARPRLKWSDSGQAPEEGGIGGSGGGRRRREEGGRARGGGEGGRGRARCWRLQTAGPVAGLHAPAALDAPPQLNNTAGTQLQGSVSVAAATAHLTKQRQRRWRCRSASPHLARYART
eukprot:366039-Chlamydomonas_euryale.AAC.5